MLLSPVFLRILRKPLALLLTSGLLAVCGCHSEKEDPAAAAYRANPNGKDLYAVLNRSLHNHDSMDRAQHLLGAGIPADEKTSAALQGIASKYPKHFPEGVQPSDKLVGYRSDGRGTLFLQFRDGVLINHKPEEFAHYESMQSVGVSRPSG